MKLKPQSAYAKITRIDDSIIVGRILMNQIEKLQDVLNDEMDHQLFYNEQFIRITDPAIRQFFMLLRDDKTNNVTLLQSEINKMMQQGNV
jgi:hypothetical protein